MIRVVTLFFFLRMLVAALASPDAQDDRGKLGDLVVQERAGEQVALAAPA